MEILQYGFMQRALAAGILVALVCPLIGLFLVLRRLSLIGDTLAHFTLAGVAAGLLSKTYPVMMAMLFSVGAALGVEQLRQRYRMYAELAIAIMLSTGIGLGVILVSMGSFNTDLFSYLFGSILAVTPRDVYTIAGVSFVVAASVIFFYKELFLLAFDEEAARVAGVPVQRINLFFAILTALMIAVAMRVVGILLVSSLMVLPVATALQVARSFKGTLVIAVVFSLTAVTAGLTASYYFNLAPGGTIVLTAVGQLLVVLILKSLKDSV